MMRKALFALAMVFLVSMASAYAQTAKQDDTLLLKKNKTQPSVQPAGAPAPAVHPAAGAVVKPIAKRPAPGPSPLVEKGPRPGGESATQQPKFGNAPTRTPPPSAAKDSRPRFDEGKPPRDGRGQGQDAVRQAESDREGSGGDGPQRPAE